MTMPVYNSIGQFKVVARQDDVEKYNALISSLADGSEVLKINQFPLSFTSTWLTQIDVRRAILRLPHFSLGHCILIGQSFDQFQEISCNLLYTMNLAWRDIDQAKNAFEIYAAIENDYAEKVLVMTSRLLIISRDGIRV